MQIQAHILDGGRRRGRAGGQVGGLTAYVELPMGSIFPLVAADIDGRKPDAHSPDQPAAYCLETDVIRSPHLL